MLHAAHRMPRESLSPFVPCPSCPHTNMLTTHPFLTVLAASTTKVQARDYLPYAVAEKALGWLRFAAQHLHRSAFIAKAGIQPPRSPLFLLVSPS